MEEYKKKYLLKSHEKTKKRAEKMRKKLNKKKPESSSNNDYEASLAKRVEAGDKNAIRSWQRLKMLRKQRKK